MDNAMSSVQGGKTIGRARPRRHAAGRARRPPPRPAILGHLRSWNVIAAFGSAGDARRACAALRGAQLKGAVITTSQADAAGDVRLGGYASDRTVGGGLAGALVGLFVGGLVANTVGATAPFEVIAALLFGIAGGAAMGGMVAGAADPAAGDRLNAALERLSEGGPAHVAAHCIAADDATLAAQVLAGLGPVDLYCLDRQGQVIW